MTSTAAARAVAATTPAFRFDPETHTYRLGHQVLPSVTQVLGAAGFSDWLDRVPPDTLFEASERGRAAHRALELYDLGKLDFGTLPDSLAGYVWAWERYLADSGFKVAKVERAAYHPLHRYAGMTDRLGDLAGAPTVLDFKTGGPRPEARLQLSAYAHLFQGGGVMRRIALYLDPNGKYRVKEFPLAENGRDFQVFLSCLAVANWKATNR